MNQTTPDILIVDDDAFIRDMVVDILTDGEHSYSLRTAPNGAVALEMIRERMPSLVLLDVNMPVMNGEELFVELRRGDFTNLPILFMTASMTKKKLLQHLNEHVQIGSIAFLPKPFDIDVLSKRVAGFFAAQPATEILDNTAPFSDKEHYNGTPAQKQINSAVSATAGGTVA